MHAATNDWDAFLDEADEDLASAPATGSPRKGGPDFALGARTSRTAGSEYDGGRHPCEKCGGSGRVQFGYVNIRTGECFKCNGRGWFKQSAAARRAQREKREAAKVVRAREVAELGRRWLDENPAVRDWLQSRVARGSEFAASLSDAVLKYGSLTERQLAAVERAIAQDAERAAERAAREAEPKPVPAFSGALLAAFASAKANELKRPRLTILGVTFTAAPDQGKNPGCLYLKEGDTYLGKIAPTGEFSASRELTAAHQAVLDSIGENPLAAAQMHGQRTGQCSCCGRELTNALSIELGIGPICREKWGWA